MVIRLVKTKNQGHTKAGEEATTQICKACSRSENSESQSPTVVPASHIEEEGQCAGW
jgi:hypothetical protein